MAFPIVEGIPDFRLTPGDRTSLFYEAASLDHEYGFQRQVQCYYRVNDHFPDLVGFEIRRKQLMAFLEKTDLPDNISLLDLGSADGIMAQFLVRKKHQVVCADLSHTSLHRAITLLAKMNVRNEKSVQFVQCDAQYLPFEAATFNVVVCTEVIEHVENSTSVMSEIKRVLKKNGWLYLTTPNARGRGVLYGPLKKITSKFGFRLKERRYIYKVLENAERSHRIQAHIKEYTTGELETLIRGSGFSIMEHKTTFITYLDLHMLSKLFWGIDRFLCFYPLVRGFSMVEIICSRLLSKRGHIQICIAKH